MSTAILGLLRRNKRRRILILSAGDAQTGIQGMYLMNGGNGNWEQIAHAGVPYPQRVTEYISKAIGSSPVHLSASALGWLDYKVSQLFVDCARATMAQVAVSAQKRPHYIVFDKLTLWKGGTGENLQQAAWDVSLGDPQLVASSLGVPAIADFTRHSLLAGANGALPVFPGNLHVDYRSAGTVAFVNIGLAAHLTIVDKPSQSLLLDSDTGPGILLINRCAAVLQSGGPDMDGASAVQGKVDGECLHRMASAEWFLKPSPKLTAPELLEQLLQEEPLSGLSPSDRLATVTALTARTIYEFYRREYTRPQQPDCIWICGSGASNRTLLDYLRTYFDSLPVKNIEELGINAEMRIPLALGLTVDAFIGGAPVQWETGNAPKMEPLGRWVVP
jgi:anhydro-N-acetylmuramic acid kinase